MKGVEQAKKLDRDHSNPHSQRTKRSLSSVFDNVTGSPTSDGPKGEGFLSITTQTL